jgi:hypothetical protein
MQARKFMANQMNRQGKGMFAAVVGMVQSAFVATSSISIWHILHDGLSTQVRWTRLPALARRATALSCAEPVLAYAPAGVRTPCRSS